jgi:hypothetical protein
MGQTELRHNGVLGSSASPPSYAASFLPVAYWTGAMR